MKTVGIGIIGVGEWARTVHIPNLLRVEGSRVAALASRSRERLDAGHSATRARGDDPDRFTDYRDLLQDPAVDAVIVCTPNNTHESISIEALDAGKHVLCEKPASFTLDGCDRIREAARRSAKVFQVGLELRYADVSRALHRLVKDSAIGPVAMAHTLIWRDWGAPQGWRAGEESSGGIYLELAVHYLDLLHWLVGTGEPRVFSTGSSALGTPITDHFWTTLSYPGGAFANLGICIFAPAENLIPVEIVGTEGRIAADIMTGRLELWRRDGTRQDLSPPRPNDYHFDGFPGSLESLQAFAESIRSGTPPLSGIEAATTATGLALAAAHSEKA